MVSLRSGNGLVFGLFYDQAQPPGHCSGLGPSRYACHPRPGNGYLAEGEGSEPSKPWPATTAGLPKTAGQRDSRRKRRQNKEKERTATGTTAGQRRDRRTGAAARKSKPAPTPRAAAGAGEQADDKQRTRRDRKPRRKRALDGLVVGLEGCGLPQSAKVHDHSRRLEAFPGRSTRARRASGHGRATCRSGCSKS
jgi:hypothetical protein